MEEELKLRIMNLEAELNSANAEIDHLRSKIDAPAPEELARDNEIYALDRRATLSEVKNKEHANALSLSVKKIMSLEQSIKLYKFTAKDVAKCLGDCLHDGTTMNISKEELDEMYKAANSTNSQAADSTLSLRLAQKTAEINNILDSELQQALRDVPPGLREKIRGLPSYDDSLNRHMRTAETVRSDMFRLLSSIEEATLHFDQEFDSIIPVEDDMTDRVRGTDSEMANSPLRITGQSSQRPDPTPMNHYQSNRSSHSMAPPPPGQPVSRSAQEQPSSRAGSTDDVGYLTIHNFFK